MHPLFHVSCPSETRWYNSQISSNDLLLRLNMSIGLLLWISIGTCNKPLIVLRVTPLTSTPRPLIPPAPHPVSQALDVSRADAVVSSVTGEDYFGAILVVRAIHNPPFAVVQREGAEAGTRHNWGVGGGGQTRREGDVILGLVKRIDSCFSLLSHPLFIHQSSSYTYGTWNKPVEQNTNWVSRVLVLK